MEEVPLDWRGDHRFQTRRQRDREETLLHQQPPRDCQAFARVVHGLWGIESRCHWSLDMTFRKDESTMRELAIRENCSWTSHFLISLLKQYPSKNTVVGRRPACG